MGISKEEFLDKAKKEMLKDIDLNKKSSNDEVNKQIEKVYMDRDKIIKDLQVKNRGDFAKDKIEFDKFKIKNRAELEALLKENKGFRKIIKRWGLINTYDDFICDYELSLNNKRRLTLENEETLIEQLYSNFMQTKEQYKGGNEPAPYSPFSWTVFSSDSWHDNSSQTSGNGSGSNGGSGGGG